MQAYLSNDPTLCPMCGLANQCTLADPRTVDLPCWCFNVGIDPARLAALPESARDQTCLCPNCAGVCAPSKAAESAKKM